MKTTLWVFRQARGFARLGKPDRRRKRLSTRVFRDARRCDNDVNAAMFFVGFVGVIARRSWMQWRIRRVLKAIELPPRQFQHEFRPPQI
jgi:hypothetical protein